MSNHFHLLVRVPHQSKTKQKISAKIEKIRMGNQNHQQHSLDCRHHAWTMGIGYHGRSLPAWSCGRDHPFLQFPVRPDVQCGIQHGYGWLLPGAILSQRKRHMGKCPWAGNHQSPQRCLFCLVLCDSASLTGAAPDCQTLPLSILICHEKVVLRVDEI